MNIVILSALSALSACLTVAALKVFKRYFQGNVAGFARDPLMQRTMDQATQDGFEQGDDFFEITAAMRDTVLAKLTHLFFAIGRCLRNFGSANVYQDARGPTLKG